MRGSCLNTETLARYLGGELSEKAQEQVEAHLAECDACRKDLVVAYALTHDKNLPDPEPLAEASASQAWQRIKEKSEQAVGRIYHWIKASAPSLDSLPQPAMVRSNASADLADYTEFEKEIDDLKLKIYAERTGEHQCRLELSVSQAGQITRNLRATLIQPDGTFVSRLIKAGTERFDDLDFGEYRINLIQYASEKGNFCFEIHADGIREHP